MVNNINDISYNNKKLQIEMQVYDVPLELIENIFIKIDELNIRNNVHYSIWNQICTNIDLKVSTIINERISEPMFINLKYPNS